MCLSLGATFFQVLGAVLKKWVWTVSRLQSRYKEAVYFLPLSSFDQPWKDDRV